MLQRRKAHWSVRSRRFLFFLPLALIAALVSPLPAAAIPAAIDPGTYTNPLKLHIPGDGLAESCADPTVFHGQRAGDRYWYMFCTKDPLNGGDKTGADFNFHVIPMYRSLDLVNWTYLGDAFKTNPEPAEPQAGIFAPEVVFFNNLYHLYYTITDVTPAANPGESSACHDDSAIAVATSLDPTGPWSPQASPVVAPRPGSAPPPPGCTSSYYWNFDPDVITDLGGQKYLYYGSYFGGIQVRPLSADGTTTVAGSTVQITIPNRYEGAEVQYHGGYYYLFVSATNCCNGPLTGYSVFAGRSARPTGPFVDREGVSLLAGRVGGTPVLSMNGNRWVGPGHNTVFTDFQGQTWTVYHAVDRFDPYFAGAPGFTKRPALLDRLDWIDGWPTVNGGQWASDTPQQAPAAQPGERTHYKVRTPIEDRPGKLISDEEFSSETLGPQWSWVRQPAAGTYGFTGNTFRFDTQAADLYVDSNNASVLTESAPQGEYVVDTRVHLNLPAEGCCYNYVQAGLVIYGNDDNFIKLAHVSIFETRQTEFAKELAPVPAGYPRYGNTVVGPPSGWTYLRIVKRLAISGDDTEQYTAYTSQDGTHWVRGGTWTHNLGSSARIGLISMGGTGFTANFDYVRVYRLKPGEKREK